MGSGFAKKKKEAKIFQKNIEEMQSKMKNTHAIGSSGSGLVEITLNGDHEMTSIKIKPDCVDPNDIEGLEDLITAAYGEAVSKIKEASMEFPSPLPNLGKFGL